MKDNYTEIAVVLDRSGSMAATKTDAEGGFNQFVEDQKKVPGECRLSLCQFHTIFEEVYNSRNLSDVPTLKLEPRGSTALLDAIGRTIISLGKRLSDMPEQDRPGKVIVLIVTDGEENASRAYTYAKIDEMITTQRDTYKWTFIFLCSNQDAITTAAKMGIGAGTSLTYANNSVGTQASYTSTSNLTARVRSGVGPQSFVGADRAAQKAAGA